MSIVTISRKNTEATTSPTIFHVRPESPESDELDDDEEPLPEEAPVVLGAGRFSLFPALGFGVSGGISGGGLSVDAGKVGFPLPGGRGEIGGVFGIEPKFGMFGLPANPPGPMVVPVSREPQCGQIVCPGSFGPVPNKPLQPVQRHSVRPPIVPPKTPGMPLIPPLIPVIPPLMPEIPPGRPGIPEMPAPLMPENPAPLMPVIPPPMPEIPPGRPGMPPIPPGGRPPMPPIPPGRPG